MSTGIEHLARLEAEARDTIAAATDLQALTETRSRYLGKSGSISGVLRGIGSLDAEQRRQVGAAANASKDRIEAWASARREELERARIEGALRERSLDVTLPGLAAPLGRLHPITRVMRDMEAFFTGLGFSVAEGPEVETDWNNFGALNVPNDHPSRDVQETFFVEGGHVLRTHTSSVQVRAMAGRTPPFRFIAPGRVYRRENDGTHSPVFHQIEGMLVDERVTFGDLKGVLHAFARHLMGPEVRLRFRAHFFPFTEPSAEMDFSWGKRWLEWGGCGMIHPNVLRNCGIDPERYQGFAFGMGIDRTAMLRYGVPHLHHMFDSDVRLLEQIA